MPDVAQKRRMLGDGEPASGPQANRKVRADTRDDDEPHAPGALRREAGMSSPAIDALRNRVKGEVIAPEDPAYDEARRVFNGSIDKRPAAVVRCTGPADVAAVIGVGRAEGLDLSVRGGGHSAPGFGTNDGGLV